MENVGENGQRIASYDMTLEEQRQLKHRQNHGTVEMVPALNSIKQTGNIKLQAMERLARNYMVPAHDYKHAYYVILENPLHDEQTGERIDRGPTVQVFSKAAFKQIVESDNKLALRVTILHDPTRIGMKTLPEELESEQFKTELQQKKSNSEGEVIKANEARDNAILEKEVAEEELKKLKEELAKAQSQIDENKNQQSSELVIGQEKLDNEIDELEQQLLKEELEELDKQKGEHK